MMTVVFLRTAIVKIWNLSSKLAKKEKNCLRH